MILGVTELLEAGRKTGHTLMGAYVYLLMQCDWVNTQADVAEAINEGLGTNYNACRISDILNGHKKPSRAMEDLARREILDWICDDTDEAATLIELLGL